MKNNFALILCLILVSGGCKKSDDQNDHSTAELEKKILVDFTYKVALPNYFDLQLKADLLNDAVINLDTHLTDANLLLAQQAWRNVRASWEQCEGWLFGPVEDNNYDPEIDDWPVNHVDMDSLLAGNLPFDEPAIHSFQTALKGFHPMEYLLFGPGGNKTAAQITLREREYLNGLALHLHAVTHLIYGSWNPAITGSFAGEFTNAGEGSNRYATRKDALVALVTAMAGICDEVANGKMEEPLAAQDPALEESRFSGNSVTDFKNNISGVSNVYFCKYTDQGTGLNVLVAEKNIALDNKIQQQINSAITSFNNITLPYGQAIFSQQVQIMNTQHAINELKTTLEEELLPFIILNVKN